MRKNKKKAVIRNPLYNHPLMKKGAVHGKSGKAARRLYKVYLSSHLDSE